MMHAERKLAATDICLVLRRLGRLKIACSPLLSTGYYYFARDHDGSWRGLRPATELVVDAYPRCANSFFARRIIHAQQGTMQIAHHTHAAGILVTAVRRGIPTVTILREPRNAIVSFAVYLSSVCGHAPTATWLAIKEYIAFHEVLIPIVNELAILSFEDVTHKFFDCIDAINQGFGLGLRSGEKQAGFEEEADSIILAAHRFYEGASSSQGYVARKPVPDQTKKVLQARFHAEIERDRYAGLLGRAESLYQRLGKNAMVVERLTEQL